MKINRINYILMVLGTVLLFGCFSDKGNYDYREISKVKFVDFKELYTQFNFEDLKIEPTLEFSDGDGNPSRYSYEWVVCDTLKPEIKEVIGTERNLNYNVKLSPNQYKLYYKVKDNHTDIIYSQSADLIISTNVTRGYVVMGEDEDGFADINMVAMPIGFDTIIIKNLLKESGLPRLKNPITCYHTGANYAPHLWAVTEDGAYDLNSQSFKSSPDKTVNQYIVSTPLPSDVYVVRSLPEPQSDITSFFDMQRSIVLSNGYCFLTNTDRVTEKVPEIYTRPIYKDDYIVGKPAIASPYLFFALLNQFDANFTFYDVENDEFMRTTTAGLATRFKDPANAPFPTIQKELRRKLVYGENTLTGGASSYALMKDANDLFYIYKFIPASMGARAMYPINENLATDIKNAKLFAFATFHTSLIYAVGSKLYQYNYNPGKETIKVMDLGDEITMLKFDVIINKSCLDLYVATWNSAKKGVIHKYVLGNNPDNITLTRDENIEWNVDVNVKSMNWKNSN